MLRKVKYLLILLTELGTNYVSLKIWLLIIGVGDWGRGYPLPQPRLGHGYLHLTHGKDLGPETRGQWAGYPFPLSLWTDKQSENITFPRTSYAGGNKGLRIGLFESPISKSVRVNKIVNEREIGSEIKYTGFD